MNLYQRYQILISSILSAKTKAGYYGFSKGCRENRMQAQHAKQNKNNVQKWKPQLLIVNSYFRITKKTKSWHQNKYLNYRNFSFLADAKILFKDWTY